MYKFSKEKLRKMSKGEGEFIWRVAIVDLDHPDKMGYFFHFTDNQLQELIKILEAREGE